MVTALLLDYKGQDPNGIIEKILDPIIAPLGGFSQLRIFIYGAGNANLAERQQREKRCQSAIDDWKKQEERGFESSIFYDVYGATMGPCQVWFKNIWLAFQDPKVQRIVYLPYDITYMIPQIISGKADARLQRFIDSANTENVDLFLGNYECLTEVTKANNNNFLVEKNMIGRGKRKDIPKNFLEHFTVLELNTSFPESMKWFSQKRSDVTHTPHPRTGFFSLSRRFYEEFIKSRSTMMPWAGTVQLLICAVMLSREGKKEFKVVEQFVTELEEPSASFVGYGSGHQRQRIAFVIANECHYWSRKIPGVPL